MALSQKHRSVLFDHFAPQVGEDVAEALMAEFPARDGDELVTKDFLRAEIAEVRTAIAEVRSDVLVRQTGLLLAGMILMTGVILGFG